MAVITINGQIGSAVEVGQEAARRLNASYIDRQVLAAASRRMGASEAAVAMREARGWTRRERLRSYLEQSFRRAGSAETGMDPLVSGGWNSFLGLPYPEELARLNDVDPLNDQIYFQVVSSVIQEAANEGNAVILGRASNLVLKDRPGVLHVRTVAPLAFRVETIMKREGLDRTQAERFVHSQEEARTAYYQRFFKADAHDDLFYDLVVNTGTLGVDAAAEVIVRASAVKA